MEANRVNVVHNGGFLSVACYVVFEATMNDSVCAASNQGGIGLVFALSGGTVTNSVRNVTAYSSQASAIARLLGQRHPHPEHQEHDRDRRDRRRS